MEQIHTIVCPNCGAVTASNQNCEYCGSMLTKVATILCKEGEVVETTLKNHGFGKGIYVSRMTQNVINKVLNQCKKHNTKVSSSKCINDVKMTFIAEPDSHVILTLRYPMFKDNSSRLYFSLENEQRQIGMLFNKRQSASFMICSVLLDSNIETAAQFVQFLLKEHFNITDIDRVMLDFVTTATIDNREIEISTYKKKKVDAEIEQDEKEYLEAEQRYLNELKKIEKNIERAIMDERATYVRNIKRESILPSFAQIFGMVAILAMGVYWGKMYSLTTALIILGAVIALSMIVKGVSKSRRINEVNDLETFKTKYSKIKASTPKELPQKPKRPLKIYPKYLEE